MKLYLSPKNYIETTEGIDLSIPIGKINGGAKAWYVSEPIIEPVRANGYVGSVEEGGSTNFRDITFNPHGNGTHTECLGHITKEIHSINAHLKDYFFDALLITITPEKLENGDFVIEKKQLEQAINNNKANALIIRTHPNEEDKLSKDYSNSNPPYLNVTCIEVLDKMGCNHLLIDLPSVDRESDNGLLAMHHAFWQVPHNPQFHKTITEFIFVPNRVQDGKYVLNLQVAPFENDASPSRPIIYPIKKG